jgi:hypothetical protein
MGGKIWVDKRVLLKHSGSYVFDFAAQEPLYKALHESAQQNQAVQAAAAAKQAAEPVAGPVLLASNDAAVEEKPAEDTKAKKKKA